MEEDYWGRRRQLKEMDAGEEGITSVTRRRCRQRVTLPPPLRVYSLGLSALRSHS
jgi:hypothetical protein